MTRVKAEKVKSVWILKNQNNIEIPMYFRTRKKILKTLEILNNSDIIKLNEASGLLSYDDQTLEKFMTLSDYDISEAVRILYNERKTNQER